MLLGLPAALGLALLADGLVATLFHYGAFGAADVNQTRLAVMAYAVGLLGLLAIKILAPAFYARQDIRTPVKIAAVSLVVTQVCNLALVPLFAHAGLALSIGLGATLNAGLLAITLRRRAIYTPGVGWARFFMRCLPALGLMAGLLLLAQQHIDWLSLGGQPLLRILYLATVVGGVIVAYFGVLVICGFRPADFTRRSK